MSSARPAAWGAAAGARAAHAAAAAQEQAKRLGRPGTAEAAAGWLAAAAGVCGLGVGAGVSSSRRDDSYGSVASLAPLSCCTTGGGAEGAGGLHPG